MIHVYLDFSSFTGVFYVGKGVDVRCTTIKRNDKHSFIWRVFSGQRAIVASFKTHEEARRYERMLIAKYGTFVDSMWADEYACNFTMGGDGTDGYQHSKATRKKLSIARRKRPPASIETRQKKEKHLSYELI